MISHTTDRSNLLHVIHVEFVYTVVAKVHARIPDILVPAVVLDGCESH